MPLMRRSGRAPRPSKRRGSKDGRRAGRRSGLRRWLLRIAVALLAIWLVGCFLVVVEPTVNKPTKADAILVLGPPDPDGRVDTAYALARQHYAGTVVISTESDLQRRLKSACRNENSEYQVICFQPVPATTQGEAREIGRLAAQHHWTKIIVITSIYHISRARMIVERCLPGRVMMVAAPGRPGLKKWAKEFVYQTAAYLKAFAKPGC